MPNAREYLDQNYLTKEIKRLDLSNQNLEGDLIIQDFLNLESIKCGSNQDLTSLKLINLPELNYLHTNGCQITNLTINSCPEISELNIANNLLTSTDFITNLEHPEKLTHLSIHSNNFAKQDLSFLSKFTNLEKLFVDNHSQEKLNNQVYNRFTGSLQPLHNLTNLKWINIANTDLDSGLEYLPTNLRKICLINSWDRTNANYLKIRGEMERSVRFPGVTEKLQQAEDNEPVFVKNWYRTAPLWQMKKLLGEEGFKKWMARQNAQEWLNHSENIPSHTNLKYYKELTISNKNITGQLSLTDFTGLEKLNCSYNQLTNLDLSECKNLTDLNCSNNEFTSTDFLKQLPNKDKLEKLNLSNNKFIGNLNFLTPFTKLKELNLSNCALAGSLAPLEKTKELRTIILTNTDIDSGLDYLSNNCHELCCNPDSKSKSKKLANILAKHLEEKNNEPYYNLAKWREELRSNIVLSIPTERLFVIRSNIKKFVKKWGAKAEDKWYESCVKSFLNYWKGQSLENLNELSKLQTPQQFEINWYWTIPQWAGRGTVGVSGLLSFFYDYQVGAVALASPIVETITSYAKQNLYEVKAEKWEEFTQDATELLDNYHELAGILKSLRGYKVGTVDKTLEDLDSKSGAFLTSYDTDGNDTVDLCELQDRKGTLAQDLSKENPKGGGSQLGDIVQAMIELEEEINKYRRGFYYGASEEEDKEKTQNILEKNAEILEADEKEEYQAQQEVAFDLDKHFEEKEQLETQIQIPPK